MHSKQMLLRSATMKINRFAATARETLTTVAVMKSSPELQDQIRRRAYELYEQRGRNDGHEVSDWLQAESEVAQKKIASAPRTDRGHGAASPHYVVAVSQLDLDGMASSFFSLG
jgi:hypothetical protein